MIIYIIRKLDTQIDRQMDGQMDGWMGRQICLHIYICIYIYALMRSLLLLVAFSAVFDRVAFTERLGTGTGTPPRCASRPVWASGSLVP